MERFPQYLAAMARANNLENRVQWLFYPGMLQDSSDKWWDDFGRRTTAHEGIDICFFKENKKKITHLTKWAQIPAMDKGLILNRCEDFLGESLVITHGKFDRFSPEVIFVYSHLKIKKDLTPGCWVQKDQIIARIFDTSLKQSKLPPHLHISCIELSKKKTGDDLTWNLFSDRKKVNLINPVFI
ncbi:MAG: hypothetical protein GY710_07760 [Desulfobacteraceae bacterium]|nr:hypothetical protein [Desulfobacteraceae bacterium]